MAESTTIVVDLGSQNIKAGYAHGFPSEEEPRLVTPSAATVSARSQGTANSAAAGEPGRLVHPIQRGVITDWDVLESLLYYSLYAQLGWVEGAEAGLLVVEPLLTSRDEREQLAQLAFEAFNVSGYFATDSAVASLYAVGRTSGIVVDVGYEKIDVAPVLEGLVQPASAARLPYGGRQLTEHLRALLQRRGAAADAAAAEQLKLACVRVAQSAAAAAEAQASEPVAHTLPDGQSFSVSAGEGYAVGEALLAPAPLGLDLPSLAECVHSASLVTPVHGEREARRSLVESVLVCGGGAATPGLPDRLLSELRPLAHPALPPALCPVPQYMPVHTAQRAAWVGGAVLAKVAFGKGTGVQAQLLQPVTKADYEEIGPAAVHRKCS